MLDRVKRQPGMQPATARANRDNGIAANQQYDKQIEENIG
jgi:hypothetical protein